MSSSSLPPEILERIASFLSYQDFDVKAHLLCFAGFPYQRTLNAISDLYRVAYVCDCDAVELGLCMSSDHLHDYLIDCVTRYVRPLPERLLKAKLQQHFVLRQQIVKSAILFDNLRVLEWLHAINMPDWPTSLIEYAAQKGRLEIVQWLHNNDRSGVCTEAAMDNAALHGHLDVVKWLHENRTEGCTTNAMDWAAKNGHLHVIKWLHQNRTEGCTTGAMDEAAGEGWLEVIKYLHKNRTEGCTVHALSLALVQDMMNVVYWMLDKSLFSVQEVIEEAHSQGIYDLVEELEEL